MLLCSGVLADYGSVSNYCSQNSKAPVLMVPPNVAAVKTNKPGTLCLLLLLLLPLLGVKHLEIKAVTVVAACCQLAFCRLIGSVVYVFC